MSTLPLSADLDEILPGSARPHLRTLALNCLRRNGIHTVGDLLGRNTGDLLDMRTFGASCLALVQTGLAAHGLRIEASVRAICEHRVDGRPCGATASFRIARGRQHDTQNSCRSHVAATIDALMQEENRPVTVNRIGGEQA